MTSTTAKPTSLSSFDKRLKKAAAPAIKTPANEMSFHEWLHTFARVRVGNNYIPYSVDGREPLFAVILVIDYVLGNDCTYADNATRIAILGDVGYGKIISDAKLEICGGAQFGKTILALLLKTYLGTVKFRGCMYCLPDDDLVQGIIDTKERPDVIDQIPYVGTMLQIGKDLTKSGRAANRKGAMLYTDGKQNAVSMMRGMGKFPTSFTADCVIVDERDDVKEVFADYLPGRMTTSDLRFLISMGTQRYHGAGQNALFTEGSQHVGHLTCSACGRLHVPEEEWPQICRMSVSGVRSPADPQLDNSGRFVVQGNPVARYHPEFDYYFGCVACGKPLDRTHIAYEPRLVERIAARHWSIRVAQLSCSGLPVQMFVNDWCNEAVRKSNKRIAFNCDRLAIPKSTGQKLTPAILDRAQQVAPFDLSLSPGEGHNFGGLDTGDQCWFTCRSVVSPDSVRLTWLESIADSDTRTRAVALFNTLKLDCLFVDAGPLRDLARDLALDLNGLRALNIHDFPDWEKARIVFPSGVIWDGARGVWQNLKCAPVEFSAKPGSGVLQQARLTPDTNHIYPVISCNRDEAIQAVVDDFLTAEDGFAQINEKGELRTTPRFLLPRTGDSQVAQSQSLALYKKHLLIGACVEKDDDGKEQHYVDGKENHYLLSTTYARLAEQFAGVTRELPAPGMPKAFDNRRAQTLNARKNREVLA